VSFFLRRGSVIVSVALISRLLITGVARVEAQAPYELRIHTVLTADDDGSRAATITGTQIANLVATANDVWAGAGIHFEFDPALDVERRSDSRLNNDCTILSRRVLMLGKP
jgi:hypothetical protein